MLYFLACLVGQTVTVKLKNQTIYEGVFHSCSTEGDLSITLKSARKVPTGNGKSGEVKEELVVAGKEFLQVSAANVPPEPKQHSAFKTDGEIAEGWGEGRNRELVAWKSGGEASAPAGVSLNLESGGRQIGTWNQFEYNEKQFGITSTYSEDLYTTKLDPSKIPEQKRKDAERIAREIESGQSYGRIEEGVNDDVDEEAQFSAVGSSQAREPVHAPLTVENVSQHDAASAAELHAADGFAREHRAKRYMITAHSRAPQLSEMKSINALNLEPALPKFDDKTRSDWINFKQSQSRTRQGQPPAGIKDELQQSLQAIQQKDATQKSAATPGQARIETTADTFL
ncbi:CID4 [Symbiodinium sp. KB8]|nr:CID4 [Symbiodinium sp. KB8]